MARASAPSAGSPARCWTRRPDRTSVAAAALRACRQHDGQQRDGSVEQRSTESRNPAHVHDTVQSSFTRNTPRPLGPVCPGASAARGPVSVIRLTCERRLLGWFRIGRVPDGSPVRSRDVWITGAHVVVPDPGIPTPGGAEMILQRFDAATRDAHTVPRITVAVAASMGSFGHRWRTDRARPGGNQVRPGSTFRSDGPYLSRMASAFRSTFFLSAAERFPSFAC
jgi:hypothetical protein